MEKICVSLLIIGILLSSCRASNTVVLHVAAKGSDGAPLEQAQIHLNDKMVGSTDSGGVFVTELSLKEGEEYLLEISKESEKSYYAPFIKKIMAEGQNGQSLQVDALLYSVPKWSFQFADQGEPSSTQAVAAEEPKTEPQTLALEPPPEYVVPEKETKPPQAKTSEESHVPSKTTKSEPTQPHFEKNTLQRGEQKLQEGDILGAVEIFKKTAPTDKDFKKVWEKVGAIYLSFLDDPQTAQEAFSHVTRNMKTDRERTEYFLSYVKEAVSHYYIGEIRLGEGKAKDALSHFETAQKRLARACLIKSVRSAELRPEAFYFKALASHQSWRISKQAKDARLAQAGWRDYMRFASKSEGAKGQSFLANAKVFVKELPTKGQAL